MHILLNIDQKNFILSAVILTLVLILLILIFSEDFTRFKKKLDNGRFEKLYLKDTKNRVVEVDDFRDTKYVVKQNRNVTIDASKACALEKPRKIEIPEKFLLEKKKKRLKRKTGRKITSAIFYLICLTLIGLGIYQHYNGTLINFNDVSYAVVPTKSMAATNKDNSSYLEGIEELNQIQPFSMVKLHKVKDPKDIQKLNIYAYKDKDNKLIIHRIVDISYRDDGVYYTFKGDNNELPDKYLVKQDQVLYEYRGEANLPLGLIVGFSRSTMGFLALVYVIIGLSVIDHYESKKDKLYFDSLNSYIEESNKNEYKKLSKERIIELG